MQQPEFDQILDLTNNSNEDGGDNLLAPPPLATPLIAFEDSINTSPKQEVPTAGKFLIILDLQWCQLESLRVVFYEAKVPSSDGYSTI